MPAALVNGQILTPLGFVNGKAVLVENGRVAALVDIADIPTGARRLDLGGDRLVPGFIDTQVNGGGGVLFNDAPTAATIAAIGAAHRPYGTTGFLPTLISDDLDVVDAALRATEDAIGQGVPGVLGVHIEGPFLNPKRKGIHDEAKFRVIDEDAIALLTSLKRGKLLLTLAPERTTAVRTSSRPVAGLVRTTCTVSPIDLSSSEPGVSRSKSAFCSSTADGRPSIVTLWGTMPVDTPSNRITASPAGTSIVRVSTIRARPSRSSRLHDWRERSISSTVSTGRSR